MGRKNKIIGICRLCGKKTELTFEHVPPQSTYNKHTKYYKQPLEEMMKLESTLNHKFKGKLYQGGIGYHSLCRDCNSFLGSTYVNSYKQWVNSGFLVLKEVGEMKSYKYSLKDIEPLKIIKHIISMFLSMNNEWYLESYPELSEFVKNPNSNELPEKYQIYSYLNNEGVFRYLQHQVIGGFDVKPINCSELTYQPYGYIITMDSSLNLKYMCNITSFKNYKLGEKVTMNFGMYKLPTYTPYILDYRIPK